MIPIYPIFYLLKGDYRPKGLGSGGVGFSSGYIGDLLGDYYGAVLTPSLRGILAA